MPSQTQFGTLFKELTATFDPGDVKQRDGGGGRKLKYLTARTVMNRLDDVLGPENWETTYFECRGVLFCNLTLTLPDGRRVSKSDAGGFKDMFERVGGTQQLDKENTDKTGPSDALKRAAAMWGIGRYLYMDGMVGYEEDDTPAQAQAVAPPKGSSKNKFHVPVKLAWTSP